MPADAAAPTPSGGDAWLAEALAAYVPPLVLENLGPDAAPPAEARATVFTGAVLLTDIAGFTKLTERMDGAGPQGVEKLSRLLNAYFTDLIELIEAHGGLVMKFAGDALMAVWPDAADAPAATAHRAAQCALFIQRTMHTRHVTEEVTLAMRVSLGAGEVRHQVLGGVGERWASRLVGAAMAGARSAIVQAEPGSVALAPGVAALLGTGANVTPLAGGCARLDAAAPCAIRPVRHPWARPGDVPALFVHVPAAVRDRIVARQSGWLAEFRHVSVLFINVPDVDDDPARSLGRAQAVLRAIQTALAHFGGTVDNLGDDHAGLTLVAAFGLPAWAHEDDASRAVRTALAVRAALRDLGFAAAIGVTTGRLFCGAIGSPRRRAYSMVGDTMNRCARLMAHAPGDVLCDGATRQAAHGLGFEFLREVELKGKAHAVAVWHPLGTAAAASLNRDIVGRAPERAVLRARLAGLQAHGEAGVVLIEGEAGIGKSKLVAEFRALAEEAGLRVLAGRGDALERASSYHPWQGVVGAVLVVPPDADEAERADRLLHALASRPEALRLAPLLNPALGLHLAENEITAEMNGQSRAEATAAMLVQLLAEASEAAPLVVILEDAHWLDSASWALALEVQRKVPRLLLALAARPPDGPAPEAWTALRATAGAGCLALGPLAEDDVLALLRQRLGVAALPAAVTDFIREKAEGHPFFSEELAYALRDAGHLVIRDGRADLTPGVRDLRSLNFPANVQGVVRERIDRLSPREQMAIKVASVTGRAFSLRTLRAIHPVEEDRAHLPECLDRLAERDLTQRAEADGGPAFTFKHNIVQEVAYGQLIFSQRQLLHRRLAEFIGENDGANFPLLAHHWRNTDTPARAIPHLDRAGDEALRRYANREAIGFLEQAIQLASGADAPPTALEFGRWHRQIGEAQHHLGRMDESRQWLAQAMRILGHPVPPPRRMKMLALPAAAGRQVWHRLRGARRGADAPELLAEAIAADNQLGEIAFFTNDLTTAVFHVIHGLNLAEALGPSPQLAELYGAMMIVTGALPPAALGDRYLELSEAALARTDRATTRAYVELLIGVFCNGRGRFAQAQEQLGAALETFRHFGNGRRVEECLTNIFYLHLFRGECAPAQAAAAQLRDSATRRDDAQTLGWARTLEAHALLAADAPAAALAMLGSAVSANADALTRTAFHAGSAVALFRLGEKERAREQAQAALDRLAAGSPVSYTALPDCAYVAEVFLGLPAAAPQARRACATLRAFARAFPIGGPRAHLWSGVERAQRGDTPTAERLWQRGREAARRFSMTPDLALLDARSARPKNLPSS